MDPLNALLTTEDVANYFKVEVVTVRRLVQRGELAAYRIGGEYRFTEEDVQQYLKKQYIPVKMTLLERFGLAKKGPMRDHLERFTRRGRQALTYAADEARAMNHTTIRCEHLLLGLVREEEGLAGRVLMGLGITLERAREVVQSITGVGEGTDDDLFGIHPATKQVLERAVQEAKQLHHNYVGTEHLLLGLLQDEHAVKLLADLEVSPEQVRGRVMELVGKDTQE